MRINFLSDRIAMAMLSIGLAMFLSNGTIMAQKNNHSSQKHMPIPEAVDLGLSVKWASFNLGANKPEEYGYYYKWGETEPSDTSDSKGWETYKYAKGANDKLTKYCSDSEYGYNGFTDNKTQLEPMDDAAAVNLGDSWRTPTIEEIQELMDKCKHEWTTVNGISGIRVIGPNGKSIFLPASGFCGIYICSILHVGSIGYYWSSSIGVYRSIRILKFDMNDWYYSYSSRPYLFPIRPILPK